MAKKKVKQVPNKYLIMDISILDTIDISDIVHYYGKAALLAEINKQAAEAKIFDPSKTPGQTSLLEI